MPVAYSKSVSHHEDLAAWQVAMQFVVECYRLSDQLPRSERYGLASQLRRSAVSVPSNIAEGAARKSRAEFLRYLYIARASLAEAQTQIRVAKELGYVERDAVCSPTASRCFQLINGLIRKLESAR